MIKEYSKEELWKIYKKLPQELKEAIFAEETAESVYNACEKSGVEDDRISEIARYTGRVLMGILPPESFQEAIEKNLKINEETAKKTKDEIYRFVFYPVKPALEQLYKTEVFSPAGSATVEPSYRPIKENLISEETEKEAPLKTSQEQEKEERNPDTYREPIE